MIKQKKITKFFKENWAILLVILILTAIVIFSYYSKGLIYFIFNTDSNSVVEFMDSYGAFSYLIFMGLVILEIIFAPIPPLTIYIAGGILFGAFLGGVLVLIGNLIGSLIAFELARKFGRKYVEKKVDKNTKLKFDKFLEKYGVFSIFLLRINPLTTSDLFSYLAGLTKMKRSHFLIGTLLGLAPMIFAHTYFGNFFVKDYPVLYLVLVWVSIIYFVGFAYLIWRAARKNRKQSKSQPKPQTKSQLKTQRKKQSKLKSQSKPKS